MFDVIAMRLLAGKFLCETTAPEAFRALEEDAMRNDVDAYLRRIGRRLACTAGGYAYYMAFERIGTDERTEVKRLFAEIKHELRPMVNFLKFVMQALRNEEAPSPGERIDYPTILGAVTAHPQLVDELRNFAALGRDFTAADSTPRAMLDKVFGQVVKNGYLVQLDRDREVYAFTGKLDFLLEVIEFLMANEKIVEDAPDDQPDQLRML